MNLRAIFAANLRQRRLACGLSQEALAHEADIDRTYVSALERGLYSPTIDMLERLAQVLGTDAYRLLLPESDTSHRRRP
jgi:transcriptional regulator with XRE-family HTH domain